MAMGKIRGILYLQFIHYQVLYKALTSGSVQPSAGNDSTSQNSTSLPTLPPNPLAALLPELNTSTPLTLSQAQQEAIGENLEMIQNLIVQPSSPLCNPKPEPVHQFQLDAFMGQWYQVSVKSIWGRQFASNFFLLMYIFFTKFPPSSREYSLSQFQ